MSLEDKILDPIVEATNSMIANGQLPIEVATLVIQQLRVAIEDAQFAMRTQVENKIHLWDSMYGGQDKTLYTLGLRHALDIVKR
jgi:hypothetical protein